MEGIKNIIFDLGGVVLNIDFKKTEEAFTKLGFSELSKYMNQYHMESFYKDYEVGRIDDEKFIASISGMLPAPKTDQEIVDAWNALLLDFPPERIEFLESLKDKYRLFLLSNTNAIHHREFHRRFTVQTGKELDEIFEKTYYSHVLNLRKPGAEIYHVVIKENGLVPSETLFIDDTETNFTGAHEAGLRTLHMKAPLTIQQIGL